MTAAGLKETTAPLYPYLGIGAGIAAAAAARAKTISSTTSGAIRRRRCAG
jgi:hypothetical protein